MPDLVPSVFVDSSTQFRRICPHNQHFLPNYFANKTAQTKAQQKEKKKKNINGSNNSRVDNARDPSDFITVVLYLLTYVVIIVALIK